MSAGRPRAARYSFVASVTLTDLESGRLTQETTWDLSLFGCHVVPGNSVTVGSRVRVQIIHDGEVFEAQGRVMNARPVSGVGIAFIRVEEHYQVILDNWLAVLRSKSQDR
ncbi:MAG TPA: PilZ domain-containing protein [Candidatus Acidoferrum sp.]|nr:PilZ domain-containing protein [Candidatus Acidoferrum sp.]